MKIVRHYSSGLYMSVVWQSEA